MGVGRKQLKQKCLTTSIKIGGLVKRESENHKGFILIMPIGEILRKKQPKEYAVLMAMCYVDKAEDPNKAMREIEKLMRHNAYRRDRGVIRQIRHE